MSRTSRRLLPWALLASSLASLACRQSAEPRREAQAQPGARSEAAREVKLERVRDTSLDQFIELSGTLAAREQVTLAAKVAGRVAEIHVDLASPVAKGQVLLQIERTDYALGVQRAEAALAQAKAQLGLAANEDARGLDLDATALVRRAAATLQEESSNVTRLSALVANGLAPEAELEAARAALARAEAGLESAREEVRLRLGLLRERQSDLAIAKQQLVDTAVRSPLDGFVQTRWASPGEYLAAGARVLEVVAIDPLRLRLSIPEREAASVQPGQTVQVAAEAAGPAHAGVVHTGAVARLAPGLDPQNRSLLVEADIPNPGSLRPGNFVRARIAVGKRQALTVPESSVVTFAGLQKVILVDAGRAVERAVTTGLRQGGRIEIESGLAAGDAVVVEPGNLQQGQPVRVSEEL